MITLKQYLITYAGKGDSFWDAREGRPGEMPCDTRDRLAVRPRVPLNSSLDVCFPSVANNPQTSAITRKDPSEEYKQ
jgi:hypothetical protein